MKRPVNIHRHYHAHVYFDRDTEDYAVDLRDRIHREFGLPVGRVHRQPVGPHPHWSFQVLFSDQEFDRFIPWLDDARNGLTVLVHGDSGDDFKDHTEYAYWLGEPAELDLSQFR